MAKKKIKLNNRTKQLFKWKEIEPIIRKNAEYLETVPDDFINNDISKTQQVLNMYLLSLLDDFETDNGKMVNNEKNLLLITKLDKLFNDFSRGAGLVVLSSLLNRLMKVVSNSVNYFGSLLGASDKFDSTELSVSNMINQRLGVDANGNIKESGYFNDLLNDKTVRIQTRNIFYDAVTGESLLADARDSITKYITGEDEKQKRGAIQKFYSLYTGDTFGRIDRMASKKFAKEYDLTQFIYYGTIIKTSRAFCRKHIHLLFTLQDASKWVNESPSPVGIDSTYDPIVDMGGINCRHLPVFVTDEMADEIKSKGYFGNE